MEVVVWSDMLNFREKTEYAIFQRRLNHRAFDVIKGSVLHLSLEDKENLRLPQMTADTCGIGRTIEAYARRRAFNNGLDGACLLNSEGRIARTTAGNIYTVMPDNQVFGVSEIGGAKKDALEASLMRILREEKLEYIAKPGLDAVTMETATGCFVAGSAIGLKPVVSAGTNKRYFTDSAYRLADRLRSLFIF